MPRDEQLRHPSNLVSRRRFIVGGATAVGAGLVLVACGSDQDEAASSTTATTGVTATTGEATDTTSGSASAASPDTTTSGASTDVSSGTPASTAFTAADFAALGTCLLLPEMTQGPFPTEDPIERRDITEGMAGHPLRLGVQVVDDTCTPIPDALVEIWHCDVDGDYSAYADGASADDAGPGTTFFRGSQRSNADGIVEFHTVYPGWYGGRAIHIHSKVHLADATVLTTQYFFADELNNQVMADPAYLGRGNPDTTNDADGIAGDWETTGVLLTTSDDAEMGGTRALIVVGVDSMGADAPTG